MTPDMWMGIAMAACFVLLTWAWGMDWKRRAESAELQVGALESEIAKLQSTCRIEGERLQFVKFQLDRIKLSQHRERDEKGHFVKRPNPDFKPEIKVEYDV